MVGRLILGPLTRRGPAGYYFTSDITPEDARKELQKVAAHRTAERAAEYQRRPKLSLSEQVELPAFEATWKWVDRTFKLFQWLAFAGIIKYFGERTSDIFVSALGWALAIWAVLPYALLIGEYGSTRIVLSPESSDRYVIVYILIASIVTIGIAYLFLFLSWHLLEDVLPKIRA